MITKTKSEATSGSGWDFAFWFAVLSPVLGIVLAFLALLLFYN